MAWFVGLVGLLWIVMGIFGLLSTKKVILALGNWLKNTKRQSLTLLQLIVGILLLISASSVREDWFVRALGIIACLKGLWIISMPEKKLKTMIDWWLSGPETFYKAWAIFALILGVAMFYVI